MADCLFCGIAAKTRPARIVAETDELVAFRDIRPQAPTHLLVIPRRHIATLNDLVPGDAELAGRMILFGARLAREEKIDASGYRTVFNVNQDGGQTVFHIHLHVLGGRALAWPPG